MGKTVIESGYDLPKMMNYIANATPEQVAELVKFMNHTGMNPNVPAGGLSEVEAKFLHDLNEGQASYLPDMKILDSLEKLGFIDRHKKSGSDTFSINEKGAKALMQIWSLEDLENQIKKEIDDMEVFRLALYRVVFYEDQKFPLNVIATDLEDAESAAQDHLRKYTSNDVPKAKEIHFVGANNTDEGYFKQLVISPNCGS